MSLSIDQNIQGASLEDHIQSCLFFVTYIAKFLRAQSCSFVVLFPPSCLVQSGVDVWR